MRLQDNALYRNDLTRSIEGGELTFLNNKKIFITGGTGLIGSAMVDMLLHSNEIHQTQIKIFLASRNKDKVLKRFGDDGHLAWIKYDALEPLSFHESVDYIIHCAGYANPELYVSQSVETMLTNFIALNNLLRYATSLRECKLIYISSSEIYGIKETNKSFSEDDYGFLDILSDRASYASSKRASETLCKSYFKEYGVKICIARPGHIFGPTASIEDGRVSSAFARKAAQGQELKLKSGGGQIRSYMYCLDCARAICSVMEAGLPGQAYNVCGSEVTSIREISEYFSEAGKVNLTYKNPTDKDLRIFNPMDNSSLDYKKLYALGFHSLFSIKEGAYHTVEILQSMLN